MRLVYYNGKFVPETDAKISIFDSALMFGDMVFEMTRSFNKKQFKLKEHIDRLYASIEHVKIPLTISKQEMEEICYRTIEKNKSEFLDSDEHRLMINVSRGPLSIYSEIFDNKLEPTVIVADFPLKWTVQGMGKLFDIGINAIIPPCPNEIIIIASLVRPSPNAATESITDNGPKNTRPNVAIASANQALGLTIIGFELCVHIKHTSQNFLK